MVGESLENPEVMRAGFCFWTPKPGATIEVGAERRPFPLPQLPLPVRAGNSDPAAHDIGQGAYDFLRQFPDAPSAAIYAELLRDAFPHFLTDLAAQIVMINEKAVDAPFVQRKVTGLKILALLEPGNAALMQQIGAACIELGLMFTEFSRCRGHFLTAMGFLQKALSVDSDNLAALNMLAQLDYWFGDYPTARRRWEYVVDRIAPGAVRSAIAMKIARVDERSVPDHPLVDDLEAIGKSLELIGCGNFSAAKDLLEALEAEGAIVSEMPMAEFYAILGLCRERCGDPGGAWSAFDRALTIDPECVEALTGQERVTSGGIK